MTPAPVAVAGNIKSAVLVSHLTYPKPFEILPLLDDRYTSLRLTD